MSRTTSLPKKQDMTLTFGDSFAIKLIALFKGLFSYTRKKSKPSLTIKAVFYETVNFRWDELD